MPDDDFPYDVLIAGAGPVGLMLACELAMAACTVLVLERAADPRAPTKDRPFGLRGLTVPTIEGLDRRGLLDDLRRCEPRASTAAEQRQRRPGGHFAGIDFFYDAVEAAWPHRLPGTTGTDAADMATLETVLAARATALGVEIRRGVGVDGLRQSDAGVVVTGGGEHVRGRYLVGCDGGRSTVRKAAGFGFVGTDPEFTGYSVRVTLDDPAALPPGRHLAPGGVTIYAPPDTIWMADFDGGAAHRTVPLDREHVEAVLRRVSGRAVVVTALHLATSWTDRACLATTYRRGRVLLAGDAAHIHSPLGGQGLNLGLGDAMNLGWKLAAVVRGDALADLLDSYERERRPVAADILDRSRAQVALLRPDAGSRALEAIMADLIATPDGTRYFAKRISGVGLRYDLGGPHPQVGRGAPDVACADGSRLNEHLRDGRGLLVDLGPGCRLRDVVRPWQRRVAYVQAAALEWPDVGSALIRPDGIVAWVGASGSDPAGLDAALQRWFGASDPIARPVDGA